MLGLEVMSGWLNPLPEALLCPPPPGSFVNPVNPGRL